MKLRFAVIGTGNIAPTHIDAIKSIENAELKAVMSHDHPRAVEFASKYGVRRAYSNIDELLKDNEIDVVDIVCQHDLHVEYALKAVKAGKHVIIEKPIGTSLESIDNLIEESKNNNVRITVISQHRLDESFANVKQWIESGKLGRIIFVNANLIINRNEKYYLSSPWRAALKKSGGGILMMNAVHYIDVILWLLGDVKSVYGKIDRIKQQIEVEDTASALIKFKNNAVLSLHATSSAEYNHQFRAMIYGDKKSLMIEGNKLMEMPGINHKNNIFNRIKNKANDWLPVRVNRTINYKQGSIAEQIKMFVDSITENRDIALPTALDGKKALEIILAIYKSSKTGKEILINK